MFSIPEFWDLSLHLWDRINVTDSWGTVAGATLFLRGRECHSLTDRSLNPTKYIGLKTVGICSTLSESVLLCLCFKKCVWNFLNLSDNYLKMWLKYVKFKCNQTAFWPHSDLIRRVCRRKQSGEPQKTRTFRYRSTSFVPSPQFHLLCNHPDFYWGWCTDLLCWLTWELEVHSSVHIW